MVIRMNRLAGPIVCSHCRYHIWEERHNRTTCPRCGKNYLEAPEESDMETVCINGRMVTRKKPCFVCVPEFNCTKHEARA